MEKLRTIADAVLGYAKELGADTAQCIVRETEKKEFNVESGAFTLMRTLFDHSVSITVYREHRQGAVQINHFDKESLEQAVRDAMAAAESAEADEAWQIDDSGRVEKTCTGDPECDTESLFARSKEFLETVAERYPKLLIEEMITEHDAGKILYRNSYGTAWETEFGFYSFYAGYSAHEGESGSHSYGSSCRMKDLSKPFIECSLTNRELADTEKQACPVPLGEKFTGTVVFTPLCLMEVVFGTILGEFVSDRPLIEGTSTWKDKLGETVADSAFSFRLAPNDPRILSVMPCTGEGYPAEDFDVISGGVLKNFVLSQYGANKTGRTRSGNTGSAIVCEAGSTPLSEIIGEIEKGILIGRFSGGHPGANGEFSGIAKNSFLIEHGKVTQALSETMISANLNEMLHGLRGVSREMLEDGEAAVPYMAFDGITISGK